MISTWIYPIAVNTCLSWLRVEKRQATDPLTDYIIENSREDVSEKNEQVEKLYKCIAQLEENERLIITMVLGHTGEMKYSSIAKRAIARPMNRL